MFTHINKEEGLSHNIIRAIVQTHDSSIWLGSFGGLTKMDGKYFYHYTDQQGLSNISVYAVIEDRNNNLWISTWQNGVCKFDGKNLTKFTTREGLINNIVWAIIEDKDGNIWFGTNEGACRWDGMSFTHFTTANGLVNNKVKAIIHDHAGNMWFGTDEGVCSYDGKSFLYFTKKEGLTNNRIRSIIEDKNGNIWFGSLDGGITIVCPNDVEKDKRKIISLSDNNGLLGNSIYSMLAGNNGNIYIGTQYGLSMIDATLVSSMDVFINHVQNPARPIFTNYTHEDGFLGLGVNEGRTLCETTEGIVWIGTNDRLTLFNPLIVHDDTVKPTTQLRSIEVYNQPIDWISLASKHDSKSFYAKDTLILLGNGVRLRNFKFTDLSTMYNLPENLSLAYNNNYLTFDYVGISRYQNKKNLYQYKLDGLDENWSAITQRTTAPYGNLPYGKYVFRVKTMNSSGIWGNEYSYPFIIRPPWWYTLWFRLLSLMLIIIGLMVIYQIRVRTLKKQQKQLEAIILQKTSEILHQNKQLTLLNNELSSTNDELYTQQKKLEVALETLNTTQDQLIQSEKMASLGILSAGIAHEINNPLNFIKGGYDGLESYFEGNESLNNDEVQFFLKAIESGLNRATGIVKTLGAYSRKDDFIKTNCLLHSIIDDCLIMLTNHLKHKIEIVKDYCSPDITIPGNEGKLYQAFLNILNNAEQAIENTGVITIKTELSSTHIIINISDTGTGIKKEHLKKIFEPFFTTKEPGKGTGLGLSITHKIINEHNGKIEYKSEPGKGTTVIIKLPLK